MAETTYYEQHGVLVTNARFVANDRTHSISQISSLNLDRKSVGCGPRALSLIGIMTILGGLLWAAMYIFGFGSAAIETDQTMFAVLVIMGGIGLVGSAAGLGLLVLGISLAKRNRHTHIVQVIMATGQVVKLEYREKDAAIEVVQVLNQALADRG